jgi:hypothetical protein
MFNFCCVGVPWCHQDHDETVRLPHYSHHLTIDSVYTIYVKYRDHRAGFDKVGARPTLPRTPHPYSLMWTLYHRVNTVSQVKQVIEAEARR